jgi:hypothetical protein
MDALIGTYPAVLRLEQPFQPVTNVLPLFARHLTMASLL